MLMLGVKELQEVVRAIAKIDAAGEISELWARIHDALKELPAADDLDNCAIGQRIDIQLLAETAQGILDLPHDACLAAATWVSVPTRLKTKLRVIREFARELRV